MVRRYFTLPEARSILPDVLRHLLVCQSAFCELKKLEPPSELEGQGQVRRISASPALLHELRALRNSLATGQERLLQLGVELQDLENGLVDFPTQFCGREAYFCWQQGEPTISHWHPLKPASGTRVHITDFPVAAFQCWS